MDSSQDLLQYESLAFFGKINASISHELKNVMAIISETAGLLKDLSDMAATGSSVAPDMLTSCTTSIAEEIQRGFTTIRQMNRFSHSVDIPVQSVNLADVLELVINLTGYLSFAGKVGLKPCEGLNPIVLTCPFLLQAITYQALVHAFKIAEPEAEIEVSIQPQNDLAWRIIFSGVNVTEPQGFPDTITRRMAESIGVAICWDNTAGRLELEVPQTLESGQPQQASPTIPNSGRGN
jgi:signal transduction histidine kinase